MVPRAVVKRSSPVRQEWDQDLTVENIDCVEFPISAMPRWPLHAVRSFAEIKNQEELMKLTELHYDELYRITHHVVSKFRLDPDPDLVADVTSETWLRLVHYFDAEQAPEGRIVPIAARWARQAFIKISGLSNRPQLEIDELFGSDDTVSQDTDATERRSVLSEYLALMQSEIDTLNERDRTILKMRLEEKSMREIAEAIGASHENTKMASSRATEKLSKRMIQRCSGMPDLDQWD